MRRRSFLAGLGAAAILPAAPLPLGIYGRSPAMEALDGIRKLQRLGFAYGASQYKMGDIVKLNEMRYRLLATS